MGGFAHVMKNLLNWQPSGSPEWSRQQGVALDKQQEQFSEQMRQEQEDRANQQQYDEELSHALSQGARFVGPGNMVQETTYDAQGNPSTIHRPVDENRYVAKYKNPVTGDAVQLEWPNEQEQQLSNLISQARGLGPAQAANTQRNAAAEVVGQGQGAAQVRQSQVQPASNFMSPDALSNTGLNPTTPITPQEGVGLAGRYISPYLRGQTQRDIQDAKDAAAKERLQMRTDAQSALQKVKDDAASARDQNKLDFQDRWQRARNTLSSNTQANLNNRVLLQQLGENQKQHGLYQDQIFKEQQKQLDAQGILDPTSGIQDGEDFTDPFTGKKGTMNAAQRMVLKNSLGLSQAHVSDLQGRAQQIEQRYGLNGQAAPAKQKVNPQTSKPYAVGDTVKLKTGQTVKIKKLYSDGTFDYY